MRTPPDPRLYPSWSSSLLASPRSKLSGLSCGLCHAPVAAGTIEWALAQGRLYLVQARPITSLFPIPPSAAPDGERVYVCANTLQGLVAPFTPAGISAFRNLSRGMARLFGYNVRRGEGAPPSPSPAVASTSM